MGEFEVLAEQARGSVYVPGDAGYDEECAGFQAAARHRPAVVVGAADAGDVRAAVAFAGARGMGVAVQSTGHGLPVAAQGGVLVSTRRMDGVEVDPGPRTARVGAGALWRQVIDQAAPYGLAPLSGSAPHIGAVSYALGGGVGLLSRRYGYAADHVRGVDVVTADAALHRVTADTDPELFWGLRGGRGSLGVVTGIEVDLLSVASLYGGALYFDADLAGEAWRAYVKWTKTVPDEVTSSVALIPFPDVPGVPEPLRGRHVTHVRIAYAGDAATGEELVAPLRAVGPRLVDTLGEIPYSESGSIHNEPPIPMAYHASHTLLRDVDASAVGELLERVGPGSPHPSITEIRHLGGALGRPPVVPNAVGNRDARYFVSVLSVLTPGTELASVLPVHARVLDALRPWSTGGRLLNFLYGENASPENVRLAYGADDYRRLTELKARVDPADMFRLGHHIPPAVR